MNVHEILQTNANIQLVVTAADLREFALAIIDEVKSKERSESEVLYTPAEFAQRRRVSKCTLWRRCQAGALKPTRIGGKVFYKDSDCVLLKGGDL